MTSWLMKIWIVLYSTWVWVGNYAVMAVAVLVALVVGPFVPTRRLNPMMAWIFSVALRLTGCRIRVVYHPKLDKKRPSVFCVNHSSVLDGHAAGTAIPQPFTGVMMSWHFWIPIYGWVQAMTRGIRVFPRKEGRFEEVAAAARNRRDMGLGILTFPEGHRTTDGKIKPFHKGMFFLARDAGMPVVPLAVHGMADFNHKPSRLFKRGPITMLVGPQMETEGLSDDEVAALTERMHDYVAYCLEHGRFPDAD